jgi:predicted nucleic acid-binding protein
MQVGDYRRSCRDERGAFERRCQSGQEGKDPEEAEDHEAEGLTRSILAHVQRAEADFDPLPFDAAAARAFGQVASSLRWSGRKPAARALDALIAATAIANGLPLYTCNPDDFAGIAGLVLRPVPVPDAR